MSELENVKKEYHSAGVEIIFLGGLSLLEPSIEGQLDDSGWGD